MQQLADHVDLPETTCGFGEEHNLDGSDVRVMRSGAGNFVMACTCSEEPLTEADEPEHPTEDHIGFIDGKWPTPEQWLTIDNLADGWYNERPHVPVDNPDFDGTPAQLRRDMREKIKDIADTKETAASGGADEEDEKARQVPCPSCGANAGRKCQRPGGHRVRKCHADRSENAREEGVLEAGENEKRGPPGEQASIGQWSAQPNT